VAVAMTPVVEQMHQRTGEKKNVRQNAHYVLQMLADE
jgi:hypothetical protein